MDYLKRVIDEQLQDYLDAFGAVNIEGPKWCGKTTTAKQKAASFIELQDTDKREEYLATALTKASLLLEGVIDRSQIRYKYDASVSAKREQGSKGKMTDGNALSYPEATVMLEYLASVYGTDAVIDAYLHAAPLDQAFGITYAELFAAARAYYAGLYGDLLTAGE